MRIAVCDDDALMLEQLQKHIRTYFQKICVKCPEIVCFSDGESLLADKGEKDILFLDMEMPGIHGIYAGNELKRQNENKPLDLHRFFRNMKDAMNLYNTMNVKIPVETKQGVHTLPASSVIAIEAQSRKVIVHCTMRDFDSIHNMQYWLEQLPKNCFFQTHRSFIVNLEHVTDFDHTLVHMAGGLFSAYLTKRKYNAFKEAYLLYLESVR